MKSVFKTTGIWVLLGIIFTILWILGSTIGFMIVGSNILDGSQDAGDGLAIMFLVGILIAGSLYYFITHARLYGLKLSFVIFILGFGLMSFMSQIETLWFNDSLKIPLMDVYGIIAGGAITYILFAPIATWISGKYRIDKVEENNSVRVRIRSKWISVLVLSAVIWPALYISAGYFIAWQFEEVRVFYSGSAYKASFAEMIVDYFQSNLYFFQIFRGFIWVLLGLIVINYFQGNAVRKSLSLIMFFVFICCLGLLVPNPFMPEGVRMAHFIETSIENTVLALLIVWMLDKSSENVQTAKNVALNNI